MSDDEFHDKLDAIMMRFNDGLNAAYNSRHDAHWDAMNALNNTLVALVGITYKWGKSRGHFEPIFKKKEATE
jgi:hypothetical protein